MDWVEVGIFTSSEGIEAVTGRLLGLGISGFVIKDQADFEEFLNDKTINWDYIDDSLMGLRDCETEVTVYLPENGQGRDQLESIRAELMALKALDAEGRFGRLELELKNVREEDWANNWKKYFKPLKIGKRLLIKPSWEETEPGEERTVMELDPASSFGTGQHNTTKLCLELIEDKLTPGDRVLDLGCGSGILSIGARLLGAESCTAVDIDENSVRIAKENAGKNGIDEERFKAHWGNIIEDEALREELGTGYDLVCANIVADVLIAMSPYFSGFVREGGRLIVSGIIFQRKDEVLDAVKAQGFVLDEIREEGDWTAAAFTK